MLFGQLAYNYFHVIELLTFSGLYLFEVKGPDFKLTLASLIVLSGCCWVQLSSKLAPSVSSKHFRNLPQGAWISLGDSHTEVLLQ